MSKEVLKSVHSQRVLGYLNRIYDDRRRKHTFRGKGRQEFDVWQSHARPALRRLIRLETIESSLEGHQPSVELGGIEDMCTYIRQKGHIETEPDVRLPFWLLRPEGRGPFPLALVPHGHDRYGWDTCVGLARDEAARRRIIDEDRDVAVQAVSRGFITIAPATRGISPIGVPDIGDRHGSQDCRGQLIHCLLAGRTAIGERVWDMQRLIDWAGTLPEVDAGRILMMGNSGGGMVTIYAAACDPRITIAVPSCSFSTLVGIDGNVHHCDCNTVPGILEFGEFHDVAGLIAPRHLLTVNGRCDPLHSTDEVDRAVESLSRIYDAAGAPDRYEHKYGDAGHRFYKDLMWPFVLRALREI